VTSLSTRVVLGAAAAGAAAQLWRRYTTPFPYRLRSWISVETPGLASDRLRALLAPQPGERLLEIGPGVGLYSLPAARWLGPAGRLDVLDVQPEMLAETERRALAEGLTNLVPTQGDAQALPYPDDAFDGAFVVTALGEIPDQVAALKELRRVVAPAGRVVIGELVVDLHGIRPAVLRRRAAAAGLHYEQQVGGPLAYFARFVGFAANA
jgi:ubiquinone/menaquinone biosynthesis C-methylase UbiE